MSKIDYQALREAAQNAKDLGGINNYKRGEQAVAEFESLITPHIVLALLDELERNQQYIKRRDQENEDIALTVGRLRVELEGKDSKIANLTAERDALREGEMGDARHSNTRAAADIYFQLVEECEIPAGGSLVEYVDDMREKLEAAEKRIAELEKSEEQLINERDHAESALADMYFAATGDRPEWSNWFGFSDAVDAVVDRIADLEAKQCIEEMSKQSCEARERDLFESWVMHSICISKSTLEGLRTETGYRNATLSGTDFNRMWEQWKSIRAAGIRIKGE